MQFFTIFLWAIKATNMLQLYTAYFLYGALVLLDCIKFSPPIWWSKCNGAPGPFSER